MDSHINQEYTKFLNIALGIEGFVEGQKEDVPYDITDLANKYCEATDAHDEVKRSQYISALIVRYWHVVVLLYKQSLSTRLEFDDIVSWVFEAFEKAFKYRAWLDPNQSVSKSPRGAEKAINQCITSVRQYWYKNFNQDKRKVNFLTYSLNTPISQAINKQVDDDNISGLDTLEDENARVEVDSCREIVQSYINSNQLVRGIILDIILYQDSFVDDTTYEDIEEEDEEGNVTTERVYHYKAKFSPAKVIRRLKRLDSDYIEEFLRNYEVDKDLLCNTVEYLSTKSNTTLHKYFVNTIEDVKNNKEVQDWICM